MGQYHKVVNLDKKEVLNAHKFGEGIKLMEFSESIVSSALCILLAISNGRGGGDFSNEEESPLVGSWAGDRIAIIGDYWEDKDMIDHRNKTDVIVPTWDMMGENPYEGDEKGEYTDISNNILEVMLKDEWLHQRTLEKIARYDYGKDWSKLFTKEEIANERERQ